MKTVITHKFHMPAAITCHVATDNRNILNDVNVTEKLAPELLCDSLRHPASIALTIGTAMAIGTSSLALIASIHSWSVNQQVSKKNVNQEQLIVTNSVSLAASVATAPQPLSRKSAPSEPSAATVNKITALPVVPPLPAIMPVTHLHKLPVVKMSKGVIQPVALPSSYVTDDNFVYPLANPAPIGSPYGWRVHPVSGKQRLHTGIDFEAPEGALIVAAIGGRVVKAGWQPGYGKTVVIERDGKQQVLYGHMSEISVVSGQEVKSGTIIGAVGSTGQSTGPHLHFEMLVLTADSWVPIDPTPGIQYALNNIQTIQSFQSMIKSGN